MPYGGEEIVLADDALPGPDEMNQQVKNLRLEGNQIGAATQLAAVRIEDAIFEKVTQVTVPHDRMR